MTYATALNVAKRAIAYLEQNEGNMSEYDLKVHTFGLQVAIKTIAEHNQAVLDR